MNLNTLSKTKHFLDGRVLQYNQLEFIESDPIQIPHRFTKKEDIEIAGFLTATISWGQRKSILKNATSLMEEMDNSPYDFIMEANRNDWQAVSNFTHRTFNGNDCLFFLANICYGYYYFFIFFAVSYSIKFHCHVAYLNISNFLYFIIFN